MVKFFIEKWYESVDKKGTTLCAGMDPPEFEEGRKSYIPHGIKKRDYALFFVEAVAKDVAAFKPNQKFWDGEKDAESLGEVMACAETENVPIIYDCKAADIGASNDEQFLHAERRGFDAVTLACYAGNMKEAAEQCKKRFLGGIHMCLMSNPDYLREKNKLVPISLEEINEYDGMHKIQVFSLEEKKYNFHVKQYIQLAHDAKKFGLEGIVVGAPSEKNHIKPIEIQNIYDYAGDKMLILCPGIGGKQGGNAEELYRYFPANNIIANVASGLMFPKGVDSTKQDWKDAAKQYSEEINKLRKR